MSSSSSDVYSTFKPPFNDNWFSEMFARDADVLTKALEFSITKDSDQKIPPFPVATPETSVLDPKPDSKRKIPIQTFHGKPKRKSRPSKRSPTTFINADAANFRQMVQQVTGVGFVHPHVSAGSLLKPQPQRSFHRLDPEFLPTLDTSALFMDNVAIPIPDTDSLYTPSIGGECAGFTFDSFRNFPTLESYSWGVM